MAPGKTNVKTKGKKMNLSAKIWQTLWNEAQSVIERLDDETIDEIYELAVSIVSNEGWDADTVEAEFGPSDLTTVLVRFCFEAEDDQRVKREKRKQQLLELAKHAATLANRRRQEERLRRR